MRGDRVLQRILAPIQQHLDHPQVTDICVNKPGVVWVRQSGIWAMMGVPELDFNTLDAATILIGHRTGREFDESHPYVNSTLPGNQRFQGVRPPGTRNGQILWAIRRPPDKARSIDDDDFEGLFEDIELGKKRRSSARAAIASCYRARDWRNLFRTARLSGMSIAFCGATGGGKTDLARRMIQIARENTRMVTIETDDEFGEAGPPNKAPLIYDDTQVNSDEAVQIAKRLIPVEIFLQEVKGKEAYSLLTVLNSGHNGCTSWHANENEEIEALANMVRLHPSGREIKEEKLIGDIRSAFDIIAYCQFDGKKYHVTNVTVGAAELEKAA